MADQVWGAGVTEAATGTITKDVTIGSGEFEILHAIIQSAGPLLEYAVWSAIIWRYKILSGLYVTSTLGAGYSTGPCAFMIDTPQKIQGPGMLRFKAIMPESSQLSYRYGYKRL